MYNCTMIGTSGGGQHQQAGTKVQEAGCRVKTPCRALSRDWLALLVWLFDLGWYLEERLGIASRYPPTECLPDLRGELETLVRNNAVWKPVQAKNLLNELRQQRKALTEELEVYSLRETFVHSKIGGVTIGGRVNKDFRSPLGP